MERYHIFIIRTCRWYNKRTKNRIYRELNILPTALNNAIKGRSKSSKGYIWKLQELNI